jgi:hypothetical protein
MKILLEVCIAGLITWNVYLLTAPTLHQLTVVLR